MALGCESYQAIRHYVPGWTGPCDGLEQDDNQPPFPKSSDGKPLVYFPGAETLLLTPPNKLDSAFILRLDRHFPVRVVKADAENLAKKEKEKSDQMPAQFPEKKVDVCPACGDKVEKGFLVVERLMVTADNEKVS
ncbi:hypothetical protein HK102_013511 [Quaeritorhiza haematococci]|nr:hypothetical protein HK102_013511 [Quaeritorhiza haematococci]